VKSFSVIRKFLDRIFGVSYAIQFVVKTLIGPTGLAYPIGLTSLSKDVLRMFHVFYLLFSLIGILERLSPITISTFVAALLPSLHPRSDPVDPYDNCNDNCTSDDWAYTRNGSSRQDHRTGERCVVAAAPSGVGR
jgi:hypothetical protein